ncbi:hypothetical protein I4I73_03200, partial [Pseudonocardia sp. KRD-184]|nr:hypothetical protein [Pseudonocardia oceani]
MPTVHSSSPARVEAASAAASVTTASFTAPAGSVLVAAVVIDAGPAPAPTLTVSNSGTALTWTKVAERVTGGAVGSALFVAAAPTSAARTVTFTTSNSDNKSLKVYVVQGADPAGPVGDVTSGNVSTNTVAVPGLVATRAASLGFYAAAQDESSSATPTSGESAFDPVFISAQVAGGSGHKPMGAVAAETTYTIDAAGTTVCDWHYVGVEIVAELALTVTPPGVASAEAVGTPTLTAGAVAAAPAGVASTEAVGTPQVTASVGVTATGVASGEAVGAPTITIGGVVVAAAVPTAEAVGTPTVAPGPASVTATGVASGEAVGAPTLSLTVAPAGVPTAETVGTPTLTLGAAAVSTAGVVSGEVVPAPAVTAGPVGLSTVGVPSAEAVGVPRVSMSLFAVGVASGEAVGAPMLTVGAVAIFLTGVPSGEAVGTPALTTTLDSAVRTLRPIVRLVPLYEVLAVRRVPQPAGPPSFFIADRIPWSRVRWGTVLSKGQSSSVTCSIASLTEPVKQLLRAPDRNPAELHVLRNGKTVCAGPLLGGAKRGGELTVEAGGLMAYLRWMIVLADKRFDQVDQFTIAAWLIDQWQASNFGHFGIDTTAVGVSGRLRDQTYERNEIHQVSRRLEELGARRDGFDAEIDPVTRRLQLTYPAKGVDRSSGEDAVVFGGRAVD